MKKFNIEIKETLSRTITVDAVDESDAVIQVKESYNNEVEVLDADDFCDVEFINLDAEEEKQPQHSKMFIYLAKLGIIQTNNAEGNNDIQRIDNPEEFKEEMELDFLPPLLESDDKAKEILSSVTHSKLMELTEEKDLFENPPKEIEGIVEKYAEVEDYQGCGKFQKELEFNGYTFDFGLDAEPCNLRKMEEKEEEFDLNDYDIVGGDGVTEEIWEHKKTKEHITIPMEIVRDLSEFETPSSPLRQEKEMIAKGILSIIDDYLNDEASVTADMLRTVKSHCKALIKSDF